MSAPLCIYYRLYDLKKSVQLIVAYPTFCNEFADIAKAFGIQYERLRQCFVADERVNPSHTYVYPEQPYYDSHCLNKDIPALLVSCKSNKIKTPLMDKVHMINLERKSK